MPELWLESEPRTSTWLPSKLQDYNVLSIAPPPPRGGATTGDKTPKLTQPEVPLWQTRLKMCPATPLFVSTNLGTTEGMISGNHFVLKGNAK